MDPITTGALISGGLSIAGGLLGQDSQRDMARMNIKAQREFAQHGVRWRVEDAKAAGLHPLYALGAQTPSFSPVHIQDTMGPALAEAGQAIGRGISSQETSAEAQMRRLTMLEVLSRINENDARADLIREELLDLQRRRPQFPVVNAPESSVIPDVVDQTEVGTHPLQGKVRVKPAEVTAGSGVPGIVAGVPEGFQEIRMPGGWHMLLPSADLSEPLESAGEIVSPAVIVAANVAYLNRNLALWERKQIEKVARAWADHRKKVLQRRVSPVQNRYKPNRVW